MQLFSNKPQNIFLKVFKKLVFCIQRVFYIRRMPLPLLLAQRLLQTSKTRGLLTKQEVGECATEHLQLLQHSQLTSSIHNSLQHSQHTSMFETQFQHSVQHFMSAFSPVRILYLSRATAESQTQLHSEPSVAHKIQNFEGIIKFNSRFPYMISSRRKFRKLGYFLNPFNDSQVQ